MEWEVHQLFHLGRQLGITANSMGTVFCAVPIAGIIIKPFLGGVADKYNIKKYVLMGVIFSAILHFYSLQYIPPMPLEDYSSTISCFPRPHIKLQRDPCLLEKISKIYSNNSLLCDINCVTTEEKQIIVQPFDAEDDESNILLPVVWNQCLFSQ